MINSPENEIAQVTVSAAQGLGCLLSSPRWGGDPPTGTTSVWEPVVISRCYQGLGSCCCCPDWFGKNVAHHSNFWLANIYPLHPERA